MSHSLRAAHAGAPPRDPSRPLFSLRGVCKSFGEHALFRGIDLEIARGEVVTVLGASGSGKSVLLKMLNGLLAPDAGAVRFDGEDLAAMGPRELARLRTRVAMVFQGAALFDSLSVFDNVAYGLRAQVEAPLREPEIGARVAWALAVVGLADSGPLTPAELSGGMRKRVGVARAIAIHPEAILYDDPTAGLDPINAGRIARMIALLRKHAGITSVIATNDLRAAFEVSDRLCFLHEGKIITSGSVAQMRASEIPQVRDFLSGRLDEVAALM